jgi:vacuolar-type H+-ATPase subunit H
LLLQLLGENFYEEHLYQWMDAIFDSVVSQLSYPHFQATKQEVEDWCSKIIAGRIARECSSRTKGEVPYTEFDSNYYELVPVMITSTDSSGALVSTPQLKPVPVGEDRIEMVPEFILTENTDHLEGVNLFENISLKINKVTFEKTYEEAQQQVAIAKAKVDEELQKQKRTRVTLQTQQEIIEKKAEAEAKAILAKAQAEAEGMRLKGASENEIKERFAEICKDKPEYLKALLREHLPKVLSIGGGGATPLINLDSLLDNID